MNRNDLQTRPLENKLKIFGFISGLIHTVGSFVDQTKKNALNRKRCPVDLKRVE